MNSGCNDYVSIGKLIKTHGTAGELLLLPYNPATEALTSGIPLFIIKNGIFAAFNLEKIRAANKGYLIKPEGINCLEDAAGLTNCEVFVKRTDIVLDKNEFLASDLTGLRCINETGKNIGTVSWIYPGATDIVEIKSKDGIFLIPMTDDNIASVDILNFRLSVRNEESFRIH